MDDTATTDAGTAAAEDTPRPLRKDAARNRALLIAAGRAVFAERGLDASLDDVARHAGVGVGTAYRHFANKYELADAIFARAVDDIVELAERVRRMDDPWAGVVAFVEGIADKQTADRGLREVMMGGYGAEQVRQVEHRLTAPLQTLVDRAKAAGVLRRDVQTSDLGIVVMMLCTVADVTDDVVPGLWRRYLPMLLDGLRHGAESPIEPLSDEAMRTALASYKQRLLRTGVGESRA